MVVHSAQVYIQLKPLFSRHNGIGVQFTDEPTGNLDSESSEEVLRLLRESGERYNQTIIMITHSREIAETASRIIRMRDGKIV